MSKEREMKVGTGLPPLPEPDETDYRRAHRRLLGLLEDSRAACAWIEAPVGPVFLARTRRGLCRVSFGESEDELLDELERGQLIPELAPDRLDRERRELSEYFAGRRRRFRMPVDLRQVTPFERKVLEAASRIPFGRVRSYSDIARHIGRPRAQRAVGNALGRNPLAIVIPCHRVVAAHGRLGGYTGGLHIKRLLLGLEGIRLEENLP